jgi:hypothetical protein
MPTPTSRIWRKLRLRPSCLPRKNLKILNGLDPPEIGRLFSGLNNSLTEQLYDFYDQIAAGRGDFFAKEGVAGVLLEDERAHEGLLFGESAGRFKATGTPAPPTFVVTAEQYNRIARLLEKKNAVRLRLNLKATTSDRDVDGLNIIGEIPGGDKKDELVMIGAHFDSWHTGTGATDNGAGSAVMIEVMRILKTLNLKWIAPSESVYGAVKNRDCLARELTSRNTLRIPRPCR